MEGQVTPDPFLLDPDPEPVPSVRMTRVPGKVTDPPPKNRAWRAGFPQRSGSGHPPAPRDESQLTRSCQLGVPFVSIEDNQFI